MADLMNGRFYLELVKPSVDTTELIGKMIERGKKDDERHESDSEREIPRFTVHLYECLPIIDQGTYYNECNQMVDEVKIHWIYKIANFNGVSDLELPENKVVYLDKTIFREKLPQAITIGILMPEYYRPVFKPTAARTSLKSLRVYEFLGRLVDFKNPSNVEVWQEFFSINVVTYFSGRNTRGMHLFDQFVAVLQKIIDQSGYINQLGQSLSGSPKKKLGKTVTSRLKGLTRSNSQSNSWSLCKSLGLTLFRSGSNQNLPSRCWSKLRSLSNPRSRSQSTPKSESQTKSPSRFPSPPPSPPKLQSQILTHAELLEAAGLLIFRIFDPCFIQLIKQTDLKVAERHCTTYCLFIGATFFIYDEKVADACETFEKGFCLKKVCTCAPPREVIVPNIQMVGCVSALRNHMYLRAQNLALKGFARRNSRKTRG